MDCLSDFAGSGPIPSKFSYALHRFIIQQVNKRFAMIGAGGDSKVYCRCPNGSYFGKHRSYDDVRYFNRATWK